MPVDPDVLARNGARAVELPGQRLVQDVVHQRRLARARHAGDRHQAAERERHVHAAQVVLGRALDRDLAALAALPARPGHRDGLPSGQVGAGQRVRAGQQLGDRAGDHDVAAVLPRPRADVHYPVGRPDRVLVVLHDDQRVAQVAQPQQRLEQPVVVPLVQPDGRLVEHVQHPDQPGADLGGQPDPLGLTAGQGGRRAVQGQVVEPDVEQEAHPGVDFLDDPLGDLLVAVGQLQREQQLGQLPHGQRAQLGDGPAVHRHRQRHRLEPGAAAGRAGHLAHVAGELLPAGVRFGLGVPPLDPRDHALERRVVRALPAVPVLVPDVHLEVVAAQQGLAGVGGQLAPRGVHPEPDRLAQGLDQPDEVVAEMAAAPRGQGAVGQRLAVVGDDQLRVDLELGAQPGAVRAGAPGRVERERARLELVEGQPVVQAGQVLGVHPLAVRVGLRQVDEVEDHHPAGQAERGLHRVGEPAPRGVLDRQPVDDRLDVVLLVLLQRGKLAGQRLVQAHHGAVHPGPGVPLDLQLPQQLAVLALAAAHHGREDLEPGPLVELEHPVHDLLRRLPRDRPAADRAVRLADPGVQQPQVVVDLGDRPDGRARVPAGRLLVDGDRGRQPVDEVDVGLVHLAQELPGVGRQRLHVPSLALGEDGVEGQAGLARAG